MLPLTGTAAVPASAALGASGGLSVSATAAASALAVVGFRPSSATGSQAAGLPTWRMRDSSSMSGDGAASAPTHLSSRSFSRGGPRGRPDITPGDVEFLRAAAVGALASRSFSTLSEAAAALDDEFDRRRHGWTAGSADGERGRRAMPPVESDEPDEGPLSLLASGPPMGSDWLGEGRPPMQGWRDGPSTSETTTERGLPESRPWQPTAGWEGFGLQHLVGSAGPAVAPDLVPVAPKRSGGLHGGHASLVGDPADEQPPVPLRSSLSSGREAPGGPTIHRAFQPSTHAMRFDNTMQGAGTSPGRPTVGFVGRGPFWTCGSTPHSRQHRGRGGGSGPSQSGSTVLTRGLVNGVMSTLTGTSSSSSGALLPSGSVSSHVVGGDISERITQVLSNCADLFARAVVDIPADAAPPEGELTTVSMETKEQRLQWRDFLSEAVSKSCAQSLFVSYDVEAAPPRFRRPPRSRCSSEPIVRESAEADVDEAADQVRELPVVAPRGAGWSPLPAGRRPHGAASSSSGLSLTPILFAERSSPVSPRIPPQGQRRPMSPRGPSSPTAPAAVVAAGYGNASGFGRWAFGGYHSPQLTAPMPSHPERDANEMLDLREQQRQPSVDAWGRSVAVAGARFHAPSDAASREATGALVFYSEPEGHTIVQEAALVTVEEGPAAIVVERCAGVGDERAQSWHQATGHSPSRAAPAG